MSQVSGGSKASQFPMVAWAAARIPYSVPILLQASTACGLGCKLVCQDPPASCSSELGLAFSREQVVVRITMAGKASRGGTHRHWSGSDQTRGDSPVRADAKGVHT